MPSKLILEWSGVPYNGAAVELATNQPTMNNLYLTFVAQRIGQYQVTNQYALDFNSPQESRGQFRNSFLTDYNALNLFTVVYGGSNQLEITHPTSGFFTIPTISVGDTVGAIGVASIVDTPDAVPIDITNIDYVEAGADKCNKVIARITTSSLMTDVTSPVAISGNTNNPIDIEVVRGIYYVVAGSNAQGESFSSGEVSAGRLIESSMSVSVVNSPNGATASITIPQPSFVVLEYSLNNIDWQSSNTFSSLTPDTYTAYVRDDLGCGYSLQFTVTDFETEGVGVDEPVADLPAKSNSIRFFRKKADDELAQDENVMSCNTPFVRSRMEIQKFKNSQEVNIQLRSNYETITVTGTDNAGANYNIPVQKITENIGLQDSRDCNIYELPDGQAGLYFTSGNKYTYGTSTVSGSYALNGALPAWGRLGNFVAIGVAWYEIVDIGYSEEKSAEVLVINYVYTDPDAVIMVASIYNAQDYEVHNFLVDFSFYQNKFIQFVIDETDTRADYPDVQFRSEVIQTADSFPKHIELTYWNDENSGGILYSTGIKHIINLPLVYSTGIVIEETETDTTDTSAYLIESSVHEGDEFKFGWITKEILRKLALAVNHDFWEVDGVQYVKDGDMESNPLLLTNQYSPKVKGIKTGNAYTTKSEGNSNASPIELPNLIKTDGNYIKYKE